MRDQIFQVVSKATFASRLLLFLLSPLIPLAIIPTETAYVTIVLLLLSMVVDFVIGRTIWLSGQVETLLVYVGFVGYLMVFFYADGLNQQTSTLLTTPAFLLVFGSDAVSNSTRWKLFLPLAAIVIVISIISYPTFSLPYELPYFNFYHATTPLFGALTRLFFPRTKHLIHTSLDYPFARLELLSFGMKKLAAVGLKRL